MLKLLKYEIIRKWKTLLAGLTIFGIIEIVCLLLFNGDVPNIALGFMLYIFLGFASIIFLLISGIKTLKKDLFDKTGYMVFLTPNSGYKIIGSKLIVSFGENAALFGLYYLLGAFNLSIISSRLHDISKLLMEFESILNIDYNEILAIFFFISIVLLVLWFNFMLTIYLSMSLNKSIFSNVKHSGVINFILFLIINFVITSIYNLTGDAFETISVDKFILSEYMNNFFISPSFLVVVLTGVVMYLITSHLVNKKINL